MNAILLASSWQRIGLAFTWAGRGLGLAMALLFLTFLVGEGPPNPARLTPREAALFVAMLAFVAGGLALWKWPTRGALLNLGGLFAFELIEYLVSGRLAGGILPLFGLPGLLAILGEILARSSPEP
ncbi:MAG: hypothetical protein U0800_24850 [Isosphaeraceae bacterium]